MNNIYVDIIQCLIFVIINIYILYDINLYDNKLLLYNLL